MFEDIYNQRVIPTYILSSNWKLFNRTGPNNERTKCNGLFPFKNDKMQLKEFQSDFSLTFISKSE